MPQHQEPAGALQAAEFPIFSAFQCEETPSAVQKPTTSPTTETPKTAPSRNVDVFLAPDVGKTRMDAGETADAFDKMSVTLTKSGEPPASLSPSASRKLGKIAVDEKTSAVPNDKSNRSVQPDIRESSNRMQRIDKSSSYKPHRKRLMGYQVDFENIAVDNGAPLMTMGYLRKMLLQTGRIRTLGDEVTRDGSIYIMSDMD